jgi:hypothetical protein
LQHQFCKLQWKYKMYKFLNKENWTWTQSLLKIPVKGTGYLTGLVSTRLRSSGKCTSNVCTSTNALCGVPFKQPQQQRHRCYNVITRKRWLIWKQVIYISCYKSSLQELPYALHESFESPCIIRPNIVRPCLIRDKRVIVFCYLEQYSVWLDDRNED